MKKLIIEIQDSLHKRMKSRAFTNGMTIKDYVSGLIEADLKNRKLG